MEILKEWYRKSLIVSVLVVASSILGMEARASEAAPVVSGTVSSQEEGRMEGVLVSAKAEGSSITVTVVSDKEGHYSFPADRIKPGKYRFGIRAIGYELNDQIEIEIQANKPAQLNLTLQKTKDLSAQLSNAEWLMSIPGTAEQKMFRGSCVDCHSMQRIFRSTYTAETFIPILRRMGYYTAAAGPEEEKRGAASARADTAPPQGSNATGMAGPPVSAIGAADLAKYLSSVNLSTSTDGKWSYELKTLPRPTGQGTKVVITEYDLPRPKCQPHDVVVDREGMVWYVDFVDNYLGRLNPKTGETTEWETPLLKPTAGKSNLDLKIDKDGNPWIAMRAQGGIAMFNKKTQQFTSWSTPPQYNFARMNVSMLSLNEDGTVSFKDSPSFKVYKLNPTTGEIATYPMPNDFYGIRSDSHDNLYLASINSHKIGMLDAKTGEWSVYSPPTAQAGPRRGDVDSKDRFWFAEYFAGQIGMFDPKTKQIKEWPLPFKPWSGPYDVAVDKDGDVWAGGEFMDYIFRLDPNTGQITSYLLPTLDVNVRRVTVDNFSTPPVFWVGENHRAKIAKLEALN